MLQDMLTEKQMDARIECGRRMEMPQGSKGFGSWVGSWIGRWEVVPGRLRFNCRPVAPKPAPPSQHRPIDHQTRDKILSVEIIINHLL
jgi:hypothetical protein